MSRLVAERTGPRLSVLWAVLWGLLLAPAPGWARHREEAGALRVQRLLQEWRIDEAAKELHALQQTRPRDLEVVLLGGELRFLQGDYQQAATVLQETLAGIKLSAGEAAEWRAIADLAAGTAEVTRGFSEQLSPRGHFLLRYKGRDAILVPYAGEALEKAWEALGADFGGVGSGDAAQPAAPVRVEIYGETADLARVSTLTEKEIETSGTIALCKWNRLMIVSPRALVRGYPWLDTLVHEYTHFIVSRVSRNSVPIWLHEGLAKFEERRWRGPSGGGLTPAMEHLLYQAIQRKHFITFEQMSPSMAKLPSQEDTALAFAEVYTVVEYLHGRAGWPGIHRLIRELAGGANESRAIAATLGVAFDEFDQGWKSWLRGRKLRPRSGGAQAARLKFRKGSGQRRKAEEEDDSGDIADQRARNLVRLGGMLRTRKRLAAAAVEYEKAQALLGGGHPVVAQKLARTYLDLGEVDRAIAAAEAARESSAELPGLSATLGGAWLKKGEPARAVTFLELALRTNPFDPALHCGLEQAYKSLKNPLSEREARACQVLSGG